MYLLDRPARTLALLLLAAGLSGCSSCDRPEASHTDTGDAFSDAAPGPDTTDPDTGMPPDTTDEPDESLCLTEEATRVETRCDAASQPSDRCDATPDSFETWGPASVITAANFDDRECCGSVNRDGGSDNTYAEILSLTRGDDVGTLLQQAIITGDVVFLLEATDLDALEEGATTDLQIYRGEPASQADRGFSKPGEGDQIEESDGHHFLLRPSSLRGGLQSKGFVPSATYADGRLEADSGELWIGAVPRRLSFVPELVHLVSFSAEVDQQRTDLTDGGEGLHIESAELSGWAEVSQMIERVNTELARCDCLGNPEEVVTYDQEEGDPDITNVKAAPEIAEASGNACGTGTTSICRNARAVASLMELATSVADIDSDCDGQTDSLSIGLQFQAAGARLDGVE